MAVTQLALSILVLALVAGVVYLLTRMYYQREIQQIKQQQDLLQERAHLELAAAEEKLKLLEDAKTRLGAEFNNLANRIFDEKSDRLLKNNKETLESTLSPLRSQLKDFRQRVDHVYDQEARDRVNLLKELDHLKQLNQRMSDDAVNLTRALKGDNKAQGNWGEVILERVLEESGLRQGREYETQFATTDESGKRRLPDVVVRLPEEKDIVIDAKVSLVDYERYVAADDEDERAVALAAHVRSVRGHIAGLSVKEYENLESLRTLDFVLLFIPIESAFMAAFDADPEMYRTAYDKQVIVVSPTTLLATLRTIQSIWRYEHQNRNAEKIARQAGAIHDQFALVLESLDDVGRHLGRAQQSHEEAVKRMTSNRGNLASRVIKLKEMGARTKKQLPPQMVEDSQEEDDSDVS